ncbi:MAG TPA: hypothetical protein VJM08_04965 [Anaerolineales bacterium]|nr:hypothetical protein [Anaerolineales bacterium]
METVRTHSPPNYFRIAWQSALAASICLGLPAGLLFWLILLQRILPSQPVEGLVTFLQDNGILEIIGMLVGALGWGILLSKISDYRKWWLLVVASMLGIYLGQRLFWIVHDWLNPDFSNQPVHVVLAIYLIGPVLSITFCTGLAHGLILLNWKAALGLALGTSLVSVLATVVTFAILDGLGIRVGTGNAAMPKVTALCTMIAGITGGIVLGSGFSRFVEERRQLSIQNVETN